MKSGKEGGRKNDDGTSRDGGRKEEEINGSIQLIDYWSILKEPIVSEKRTIPKRYPKCYPQLLGKVGDNYQE